MFTYQGKTALITGASSGIGRAFAHALARRWYGRSTHRAFWERRSPCARSFLEPL